jgi:putative redox protein
MAVTVRTQGNYYTAIQNERGHTWFADEPIDGGGTNLAETPVEMMLGALGACMAITAKLYAERKKWDLKDVEIKLDSQRFNGKDYADYTGDATFVHELTQNIVLHGDLTDDQREKIVEIMGKCPVHRIIELPAFFKHVVSDSLED